MASSRRCTECATNWPYTSKYLDCPLCGDETWVANREEPLTTREAEQLVAKHTAEIRALEERERAMDRAFNDWFCRENGMANPWGDRAVVADETTLAPECELVC